MKHFIIALAVFVLTGAMPLHAQTLTITEAWEKAEKNYPLIKQRALLTTSEKFNLENISSGALPQLMIGGQATYQSEVTEIPVKIPNQELPSISKDQYRIFAEASQPLTDLLVIRKQKIAQQAADAYASESINTELYKIKERVSDLFFGALVLDEQEKQLAFTRKDIQFAIDKVKAAIANGTDFRSSLDKLKAEALRIEQRRIELASAKEAYLIMLGQFTGEVSPKTTVLVKPASIPVLQNISRPELKMFESQRQLSLAREDILSTKTLPKFSLFVQGGAGRPALNMLSNSFDPYYIGGLRLNWSISNFYNLKREKKLMAIDRESINIQKETFLFNTQLNLTREATEINKIGLLITTDAELLELRISIKNASAAQLENGVISINDFLREVNNEENMRQQSALHHLQLLQAQYKIKTTSGN